MAALSVDGTPMPALPNSADQINYDTTSGLSATTVKGAVDELASEKQDATDNNLTTTNKTIVGGINEVKSGLTNLSEEVNGDATVYPYADVITIPDAVPANLADCSVKIEPVQSGSGDPSPENIRPITGHTEVDVQRDGVNLIENNTFSGVGAFIQSTVFPVTGAYVHRNVTFSGSGAFTFKLYGIKNGIETVIDEAGYGVSFDDIRNNVSQYDHIRVSGYSNDATNSLTNIMVTFSDTDTPLAYVPYAGKTYTIALGDTIYGGTVDFNTGIMSVTHELTEYDGDENWQAGASVGTNFRMICNMPDVAPTGQTNAISNELKYINDYSLDSTHFYIYSGKLYVFLPVENETDFKAWLVSNTLQVCYELATPTVIQLTPRQIQLLKGTNTLTASTGQISVTVNGVSGSIGAVQEQVNATDAVLAELAEQLPTAPTTDGAYVLTVTVADGTPTYSWESAT